MFDDALGLMLLCTARFRDGVRDSFGASILVNVLEPITKDINSLRIFNEDFQRQALHIDRMLDDARAMPFQPPEQVP